MRPNEGGEKSVAVLKDDIRLPDLRLVLLPATETNKEITLFNLNPFFPTVPTCAVRETASLGIMGAPRVPPLNPSEMIVF